MSNAQPRPCNKAVDGYLYHYTDLNALKGIMEHFALWATHIEYLNDVSEHKLASGAVIDEVFGRIHASGATLDRADPNYLRGQRTLSYLWQYPYIACFTEDGGDRLSQWRGYGGSSGVCLQFRKAELQEWCEARDIQLQSVNYISPDGNDELKAEIRQILDTPGEEQHLERWARTTPSFIKDESFVEEQEWRMVTKQLIPLKHRVRGSLLVPYVEVVFGKTDLQKLLAGVIVGPTVHRLLTEKALRGLMLINGFTPPKTQVRSSNIPYRDY